MNLRDYAILYRGSKMKNNKVWKILLCCNLLVLSPSVCVAAEAVLSWKPFSMWMLLNGYYGTISTPAIIIITLITIFIIIDEYKKENLAEKDLVILIVLCLLNILASLGSREFTSMVMST